ncbi:MAG: asparagine synthetase B, partial [Bacteroidales bacterium]|nr:asparagine synthetase B [Bacteroidales bacterium]
RVDKKPFSTPSDEWFRDDKFKDYTFDVINSQRFKDLGVFDIDECNKKYTSHLAKEINITRDIWKWINMYVWQEKFLG